MAKGKKSAETALIDLGGGWYQNPDGEKVQLKADEVDAYIERLENPAVEVAPVERQLAEDAAADEQWGYTVRLENQSGAGTPPPPPPVEMPEGIDDGGEPEVRAPLPPVPGSSFPIGPYNDYAYVHTPWGEFGIPKGMHITHVDEIVDPKDPEKVSFVARYGGKPYARTKAERDEWLRLTQAQRQGEADRPKTAAQPGR